MAVTINGTTGITTPDITSDSATIDSTTLVVDDTNNRVGIGTATPSHALDIEQSSAVLRIAESGGSDLRLQVTGSASYIGTSVDDPLYFLINGNQRGRFLNSGNGDFFGVSNNGTYGSSLTTLDSHYFHTSWVNAVLRVNASSGSYNETMQYLNATRASTSGYFFLRAYSGDYSDQEFFVQGNGTVGADGSFVGGGADYAEYFEWADGNTSNEDRRGYTVVLDGNKVRKATDADDASQIIGAVSSRPSVVGDADMHAWKDKYLRDEFGSYITETHNVLEFTDEDGVEHSYESHRIPDDVVAPDDATIKTEDENGNPFTHRTLNPDYNESQEYTPREDRPEWDAVGLMGKLRIRKGQPVGDRWIKMRDISDSVEEWLVR